MDLHRAIRTCYVKNMKYTALTPKKTMSRIAVEILAMFSPATISRVASVVPDLQRIPGFVSPSAASNFRVIDQRGSAWSPHLARKANSACKETEQMKRKSNSLKCRKQGDPRRHKPFCHREIAMALCNQGFPPCALMELLLHSLAR